VFVAAKPWVEEERWGSKEGGKSGSMYVSMYGWIYTYIHAYIHTFIYIHTCIHTYTHTHTHTHIRVCANTSVVLVTSGAKYCGVPQKVLSWLSTVQRLARPKSEKEK
jgi:hypothetical protein